MGSGTLSVVMYHAVVRSPLAVDDWCFLDVREFDRQIRLLKEHFEVLPLWEGVERLRAGDLSRPAAAITFDDGFLNNFGVAFPILRRERLPATIFAATKSVGTNQTVWFCELLRAMSDTTTSVLSWRGHSLDLTSAASAAEASSTVQAGLKRLPPSELLFELGQLLNQLGYSTDTPLEPASPFRMLGPDQISEMLASGLIDFGAHTHSHVILTSMPPLEREREIFRSLAAIQDLTGAPCKMFAYPQGTPGDYDLTTLRMLERHGVDLAVTTVEGSNKPSTHRLLLRRYGIGGSSAADDFRRLLRDSRVLDPHLQPGAGRARVTTMYSDEWRLVRDWIRVSPDEVLPGVRKWGFHLETLRQFDQCPDIAPRDTAYFAGVKAYHESGGEFWADCRTDEGLVAQIEHFRRLFRRIRSHGYRRSKPITVSIDHDGSVTIYDGHHRAAIAVFLNMSIPAKVRWRHPAWIAQVSTPKSDLLAPAAGSRPR